MHFYAEAFCQSLYYQMGVLGWQDTGGRALKKSRRVKNNTKPVRGYNCCSTGMVEIGQFVEQREC